jgi:hypothetical protein
MAIVFLIVSVSPAYAHRKSKTRGNKPRATP